MAIHIPKLLVDCSPSRRGATRRASAAAMSRPPTNGRRPRCLRHGRDQPTKHIRHRKGHRCTHASTAEAAQDDHISSCQRTPKPSAVVPYISMIRVMRRPICEACRASATRRLGTTTTEAEGMCLNEQGVGEGRLMRAADNGGMHDKWGRIQVPHSRSTPARAFDFRRRPLFGLT